MKPRRPLGLVSLVALGVNGVVGIGVFFAPQAVAADVPGWRGLVVYAVVAAVLVPVAIVFAKLAGVFEQDGGPYIYARAAFGETAAFSVGWLTYVSALFGTATVVVGLVQALAIAFGVQSRAAHAAMAVTAAAVAAVVTASLVWGSIASLFALSSISVIVQYGMTAAALFSLAVRRQKGLAAADAWPAPLVVAACGLIAMGARRHELVMIAAVFGLGVAMRGLVGHATGKRVGL